MERETKPFDSNRFLSRCLNSSSSIPSKTCTSPLLNSSNMTVHRVCSSRLKEKPMRLRRSFIEKSSLLLVVVPTFTIGDGTSLFLPAPRAQAGVDLWITPSELSHKLHTTTTIYQSSLFFCRRAPKLIYSHCVNVSA